MGSTQRSTRHAVISGGCSGIGLNLVRHLLEKPEWRVVIADIRPEAWKEVSPTLDPSRTLFVETDVADWDKHATLFKKAYEWSNGQLDFYAANAGCGDKESIYAPTNLDAEPEKPDLTCVDVCEVSVLYGLKLFVHYARKTNRDRGEAKAGFNPKMVITASCAGLYPFSVAPQYVAAKSSLVALTRAVGDGLFGMDNIAVNCICPAFVDTPLIPGELSRKWPQEYITPFSTLMRSFDELIDEQGAVKQDGLSDGKDGQVKVGQSVEVVVDKLYYRQHVDYADESQRFLIEDSKKPDGLWMQSILAARGGGLGNR